MIDERATDKEASEKRKQERKRPHRRAGGIGQEGRTRPQRELA